MSTPTKGATGQQPYAPYQPQQRPQRPPQQEAKGALVQPAPAPDAAPYTTFWKTLSGGKPGPVQPPAAPQPPAPAQLPAAAKPPAQGSAPRVPVGLPGGRRKA